MTAFPDFLWYIPNEARAGHREDDTKEEHNSFATLTRQAQALGEHGWTGALIRTGWESPDSLTLATVLTVQTRRFEPLVAIRPGY